MKKFKDVFIFVIGSTPQIITETLWALLRENPPIIPDEILVITTTEGKKQIIESLFIKGIFDRFKKEFNLNNLKFTEKDIIVLRNEKEELSDVRNSEDNYQVAQQILEIVHKYTQDKNTRILASLAGGRKTMGYYLGFALSVFGRPQDRLFHILVSPSEFESNREFFYKPKKNAVLMGNLNTKDAKIELIDLPFVRLRTLSDMKEIKLDRIVNYLQSKIDVLSKPKELRIGLNRKNPKEFGYVFIGDMRINLASHQLAFYLAFLDKKINCKLERDCSECNECYLGMKDKLLEREFAASYVNYYRILEKGKEYERLVFYSTFWDASGTSKSPDEKELEYLEGKIREYISDINRKLGDSLAADHHRKLYTISKVGRYGDSKYGIELDKKFIKVIRG